MAPTVVRGDDVQPRQSGLSWFLLLPPSPLFPREGPPVPSTWEAQEASDLLFFRYVLVTSRTGCSSGIPWTSRPVLLCPLHVLPLHSLSTVLPFGAPIRPCRADGRTPQQHPEGGSFTGDRKGHLHRCAGSQVLGAKTSCLRGLPSMVSGGLLLLRAQ